MVLMHPVNAIPGAPVTFAYFHTTSIEKMDIITVIKIYTDHSGEG